MDIFLCRVLAAALFVPTSVFAQNVLKVDRTQGPYFEIQDAVLAAQSGDVILVAPGGYNPVTVTGKGLTIASAPGGSASTPGIARLDVSQLNSEQPFTLAGIRVVADELSRGMSVSNCSGPVRILDCTIRGADDTGLTVISSMDVALHNVTVNGGPGLYADGQHGMTVRDSNVALWGCTVSGSSSFDVYPDGGTGLQAHSSEVLLHGCTVSGGNGYRGQLNKIGQCIHPGDGGDGVLASGAGRLRILDSQMQAGIGGAAGPCPGPGDPGEDLAGNGLVVPYGGEALELESLMLAMESTSFDVTANGQPGDTVLLVVGPETGRRSLPAFVGDLHVGGPLGGPLGGPRRVPIGQGLSATVTLQLPELAVLGVEQWYLQTVHLRRGQVVMGPSRPLVILDSAW